MGVFQLLYMSKAADSDPGWVLPTVEEIKEYACRRNPRRGVSGMLLYGSGRFMQLLEGPERRVRETFERIRRDPRHTEVRVLCEREFPTRLFEEPSMGVLNLSEDVGAELPELVRAALEREPGESEDRWRVRIVRAFDLLGRPEVFLEEADAA